MTVRKALTALACVALLVGVVVALPDREKDSARGDAPDVAQAREQLRGAPPALAALHDQANEFLDGGAEAFEERLAELEGYPVVVNKWASWCGPCRAEFPIFQKVAAERGTKVAFVGVNSLDSDAEASKFASEFPVSYPHYRDPDQEVAKVFKGNAGFPTTAFYDRRGELVIAKQGGYATEQKLIEDIERYAR